MIIDTEKYLSARQAAKSLGVTSGRISQLLKEKKLRAETWEGRYFIHKDSVDSYKPNRILGHRKAKNAKFDVYDLVIIQNSGTAGIVVDYDFHGFPPMYKVEKENGKRVWLADASLVPFKKN